MEVTPSQFAHEAEGLRIVRNLLPDRPPYRAWSNFEFRDERGTWSEVDLLAIAPDVADDLSSRWSNAREDFAHKLYRKCNKVQVRFVELTDTIP